MTRLSFGIYIHGFLLVSFGLAMAPRSLVAQPPVIEATEHLSFDRTEAWAMKTFASVGLLTGFGVPPALKPGAVEVGLEVGWIPSLSEDQRRVGFNGTKLEDLNKTSFFGRARISVGLPRAFSFTLAYTPPVRVGGVKPNLFAAGIGRPFALSEDWLVGVRGYGQYGTIEGDITCDAGTVAAGPDTARNPFGCQEISNDEYTQRIVGGEVSLGYTSLSRRWQPYLGFSVNYLDLDFQVNASYSGLTDRTLQLTDGLTTAVTSGLTYAFTPKLDVTGEVFYSWLSVVRPPSTSTDNDGLFHVRVLLSYRIR